MRAAAARIEGATFESILTHAVFESPLFDNVVVSLPDSDMGGIIHSFVYGLKSQLRPLVKAQLAQRVDATLADAMTIAVRLDEYVKE